MVNMIREYGTRNAWNRFIRSSLLNRSIRSASNRKPTLATMGHPRFRGPCSTGAPCNRLWHIRLPPPSQKGHHLRLYKDLVKRVTPCDRIYCFTICWTSERERAVGARSDAVSSLDNLCIDKPHKYIILVARKDCRNDRQRRLLRSGNVREHASRCLPSFSDFIAATEVWIIVDCRMSYTILTMWYTGYVQSTLID